MISLSKKPSSPMVFEKTPPDRPVAAGSSFVVRGVLTTVNTAGAAEPFEPSMCTGGFGSSRGSSGRKSQQIAKSIGPTFSLSIIAVEGRRSHIDLCNGFGTIPHVLGRYTFNLVQCVGPALYVLTPTPGMAMEMQC